MMVKENLDNCLLGGVGIDKIYQFSLGLRQFSNFKKENEECKNGDCAVW